MSVRSDQKIRLKEILEAIQHNSQDILVTDHYQLNPSSYPYFFIQSGEVDIELLSNRRYEYNYTYYITLAFDVDDAINQDNVDTLEEAFLSKLTDSQTRDFNTSIWQDLKVTNISSMGQSDINIEDNTVFKVFTVKIKTLPIFN